MKKDVLKNILEQFGEGVLASEESFRDAAQKAGCSQADVNELVKNMSFPLGDNDLAEISGGAAHQYLMPKDVRAGYIKTYGTPKPR
jgi:hypothetical protein